MIIAKTHNSVEQPPNVPMIVRSLCGFQQRDALTTVIAKGFFPPPPALSTHSSPTKTADVHTKNLDQLHVLQSLREESILTEMEFLKQKETVLEALTKLV